MSNTNTAAQNDAAKANVTPTEKIPTEREIRENLNKIGLKNIDIPFMYEFMSIPSYSRFEFRIATYIILWAKKNGVNYTMDKKGNIYLTKGELSEGEFYPCMTAHMDTVQDKSKPFILAGADLPLKTRVMKSKTSDEFIHEVYINGQGIGADDKTGVFISLSIMSKVDKIKAAFFVEEEIGMKGSEELDPTFFDDVAYVVGWDSPDLNRAAWKCSGTTLFSRDFYENGLKPVVEKWGMTDKSFHSEPFTDVVKIRNKTNVVCSNFGNGGYNAHATNEYIVVEHVDHAIGMGLDIVNTIGNKKRFTIEKSSYSGYGYNSYSSVDNSDDEKYLSKLFNEFTYSNNYQGSTYNSGTSGKSNTTNNTKNDSNANASNGLDEEVFKYMVETYDTYVNGLKEDISKECDVIVDALKDKFNEAGVDFNTFGINIKEALLKVFNKEITF